MKKRKRRFFKFRKVLLFLVLLFFIFILHNKFVNVSSDINTSFDSSTNNGNYMVIKQDYNKKYVGIGQEKVKNKDGYFSTFTTGNEYKKIYKEFKQNGNASWSDKKYWNSTMNESGCGIVSLAIVLSGYGKNCTPEDLRKKYYPSMNYDNLSSELTKSYKIKNSNFYYDSKHLCNEAIINHLLTNRPIIVCTWNKPNNNRWTTKSHYMVLLATDGDNMVYVSNPNGLENDSKSSGWYDVDEVVPFIAKALFIEDFN